MTFDALVLMRLRADEEDEELIVTTSDTKRHKERRVRQLDNDSDEASDEETRLALVGDALL